MSRFSTERVSIRFAASLVANLTRAGFSFAAGLLVARTLGAANYGDLNFLLGSFFRDYSVRRHGYFHSVLYVPFTTQAEPELHRNLWRVAVPAICCGNAHSAGRPSQERSGTNLGRSSAGGLYF